MKNLQFVIVTEYVRPENSYYVVLRGNSKQRRLGLRAISRKYPQCNIKLEIY